MKYQILITTDNSQYDESGNLVCSAVATSVVEFSTKKQAQTACKIINEAQNMDYTQHAVCLF